VWRLSPTSGLQARRRTWASSGQHLDDWNRTRDLAQCGYDVTAEPRHAHELRDNASVPYRRSLARIGRWRSFVNMKRMFDLFTKMRLRILLGFYVAFAALSLLLLLPGSLSGHGDTLTRSLAASVGSFSGPFTGAIARGFQPCCLQFSLSLCPYCGSILSIGLLFQLVPLHFGRFEHRFRLAMWSLGLLGWFSGILISFGHAIS